MEESDQEGTCFVAAPLGAEGSATRERSDIVFEFIIAPAVAECGYRAVRADQIPTPGQITAQIVLHLVHDPLMIADLTERNPNVFYELAIRHAAKKPTIQLIHESEAIPFDVGGGRTIFYDHENLPAAKLAKENIVKQIHAIEADPTDVDNPITSALDAEFLRRSSNPLEKSNAEILAELQGVRTVLTELRDGPNSLLAQIRAEMYTRLSPRSRGDLTLKILRGLQGVDSLKLTQFGVPTPEAITLVKDTTFTWADVEATLRHMDSCGLVGIQGAMGGVYVGLMDLGRRLAGDQP